MSIFLKNLPIRRKHDYLKSTAKFLFDDKIQFKKLVYNSVKAYDYDHKFGINAYGYPLSPTNTENITKSGTMSEQEKVDVCDKLQNREEKTAIVEGREPNMNFGQEILNQWKNENVSSL